MPAPPLSNVFDGGSDGTTISTGNSGGTSGDAFSAIGGTPKYSAARPIHGSLSMGLIDPPANTYCEWTGLGSLAGSVFIRYYLWISGIPTGQNFYSARFLTSTAAAVSWVRIGTGGGSLVVSNAADSGAASGSATVPIQSWFRVEVRCLASTTVGQVEFRWFANPELTNPTETAVATAQNTGTNIDAFRIGVGGGLTPTAPYSAYIDTVAVSTDGWIGPANPTSAPPINEIPARHFGPF